MQTGFVQLRQIRILYSTFQQGNSLNTPKHMIQVKNLVYEYPDKRALDDVSFQIEPGSITALVGPNGAGKTTLLRSLAALSKPLSGEVYIDGFSSILQPREVHARVGYLSDFFGLYDALTAKQAMEFTAYSRVPEGQDIDTAIETAVQRAGIQPFIDKKISALSRGMRQRVGIAQAIIHQPKVLLLDEPASGLDPEARYSLSVMLKQLQQNGMTIIVSSHILAELEDYSSEMLVIEDGRMIEHRKLSNAGATPTLDILVSCQSLDGNQISSVQQLSGIAEVVKHNAESFIIKAQVGINRHELLKQLLVLGLSVQEFTEHKVNLQDEYIKTVSEYKKTRAL